MKKNILLSVLCCLIISLMSISSDAAPTFKGGYAYFDNTKTNWSDTYIYLCIGKDSYTEVRRMTKISNTKLYYNALPTSGWTDATYMAVIGTGGSSWGSGSWGPSNRTNAAHYTNTWATGNWGFNSGNVNMFTPASGSNNATLSCTYIGNAYASLNNDQTINVQVSTDGKQTYTTPTTCPASVAFSSKTFAAYTSCNTSSSGTCSGSTKTITKKAGYTATTTLTMSSLSSDYVFDGWYEGSTQLSTATTYTYYPTAAKTITARFHKKYALTVTASGNGSVTGGETDIALSTNYAITATPNSGYKFDGWSLSSSTGVELVSAASVASNNVRFTTAQNVTATANFSEDALSLAVSGKGNTAGNGLVVGNTATLQATVSGTISGTYTITFYDKDNTSIGTASGNTSSSRTVTFTTAALTTYVASQTFKAKITANSGGFTSSTYSTTTLYMATPTLGTVNRSAATINLGADETISGTFSNVANSISSVEVSITGPASYSTTTAKTTSSAYSFACKPQKPGTYTATVTLKANGVSVATSSTTFTVNTPTISLATSRATLLVDGDNTESATLTATKGNVDASATVTYTYKEGSTAVATAIASNTYSYTPTTIGTKDMTVVLNVTVDGTTTTYTSSAVKEYTKYYIYVKKKVKNTDQSYTYNWSSLYRYQWSSSGTWPGTNQTAAAPCSDYFKVELNTQYTYFILHNNSGQQTYDQTLNPATHTDKSYWSLYWDSDKLRMIKEIAPTVTLHYNEFNCTTISLSGRITNFGNSGNTADDAPTECGFTVKDNVTNISTDYPACNVHNNDGYFEHTVTGLVPGRSYSVSAWARNCELRGTSAVTTKSTKANGTTLVKVKNEKGWLEMNLYAYSTGYCGTISKSYEMTYLGDSWYFCEVSNDFNYFKVNDGTTWTEDGMTIEADCYSNKLSGGGVGLRKITCPSLNQYVVQIDENGNTYHSNIISNIADTLSFYASAASTVTLLRFSGATVTRTDISSTFSSYSEGDVFIARVASAAGTSITGLARYTGRFFVRTDCAPGGWNEYKVDGNAMHKFDINTDLYPNEYYNHYWCKYVGKGINAKAQVGNLYNNNISITLPNYTLTAQSSSASFEGTNIRYGYNNTNNLFEVKYLSSANINDFLQLYGYTSTGSAANNYIYTNSNCTTRITASNKLSFSDLSDWMYQADFYVNAPGDEKSQIIIISNYFKNGYSNPATAINLGSANEASFDPFQVMGETTTAGIYLVRVIYDYKTNRIVAAWLPNDVALPNAVLDANMMITRIDDNDAKTVATPGTNKTLTNVHKIYGVLEINRTEYLARKATGNTFYWICLPFDVKVKDVFGIEGYKSKWVIQRYRGDTRAANGYYDGQTFWRNMSNTSETSIMEAGRGYVVYVDLEASDFSEVDVYDEDGKKSTKRALKRLFFPSNNGTIDYTVQFQTTGTITSTFPSNVCAIPGRKNQDSNWYVAGVPGYNKSTISSPAALSPGDPALDSVASPPKYFYEWHWSGEMSKENYTATAVSGYVFKPFYSYMFQYAGTIRWSNDIVTLLSKPTMQGMRAPKQTMQEILVRINLENERGNLDRTFITLTNENGITPEFDLNADLSKIINSGSQIYSIVEDNYLAGNAVPIDQESVPIGVRIENDGNYLFNLENIPDGMFVYLYDRQTSERTCLNFNDYEVMLEGGTYDDRFIVEFNEAPKVATEIENTGGNALSVIQNGNRLYVEGVNNGQMIRIFDMAGKCLVSERYKSGEGILAPATGIYLVEVDNKTNKIVVR